MLQVETVNLDDLIKIGLVSATVIVFVLLMFVFYFASLYIKMRNEVHDLKNKILEMQLKELKKSIDEKK
ncbi:MAG: hypothetical protein KJ799_13365 [Bacteroidetes bacterium]|nr:hypothetical protein [Bacteroidota bacterium]MBU2507695.1 hypothetical protein [Bacteroidota bacterium]